MEVFFITILIVFFVMAVIDTWTLRSVHNIPKQLPSTDEVETL